MDRDHHPRSEQRPSSGVALGNAWPSDGIDLPLIAVAIPTEDEARTSAGRSLLLARAQTLVGFADTGRKLTQTGNLTLSDARHLVTLLETGDRLDETIGGRTFQTKSAADLPQLSFVVRLVERHHQTHRRHRHADPRRSLGALPPPPRDPRHPDRVRRAPRAHRP